MSITIDFTTILNPGVLTSPYFRRRHSTVYVWGTYTSTGQDMHLRGILMDAKFTKNFFWIFLWNFYFISRNLFVEIGHDLWKISLDPFFKWKSWFWARTRYQILGKFLDFFLCRKKWKKTFVSNFCYIAPISLKKYRSLRKYIVNYRKNMFSCVWT